MVANEKNPDEKSNDQMQEDERARVVHRPTLPMDQRRPDNPNETNRRKERASFLRGQNRDRSRKR